MTNRRDFLKLAGRTAVLGGVIFVTGKLLFQPNSEENCDFDFVCQNCKKLKECNLPEAKEYKGKIKL
ncbi:MAG: twin-arginine translocation signal domain-containing protein [Saprospiraceae bacterium]|nr:twin-arginine translocation signal domain-containing protein [Saprospiraceae bacterium]